MSVTLEDLVKQQGLTSDQREFVETFILKSRKAPIFGKKKVSVEEQQGVVLYKDYLQRREKLITLLKNLPHKTAADIDFRDRFSQAETAQGTGDLPTALCVIEELTDDAREVKRNCIRIHSRLTIKLNGLRDAPEGIENPLVLRCDDLRDRAQLALDEARNGRFDFTEADRLILALEGLHRSAPKLESLKSRGSGVVDQARLTLTSLDDIINDGNASEADRKKAARSKELLTGAISHGPLSGETGRPLDEASAKIFIKAFMADPDLASVALKEASTAKHPGAVAKGLEVLIPLVKTGFPGKEGEGLSEDAARRYGKALLGMGGKLGDTYFELLPAYLAGGHHAGPSPMGSTTGKTTDQMTQARSQHLASKVMKPGGEIDVDSEDAQIALGHVLFHVDSFRVETPSLNENVLKTLKTLKDPKATELLKSVTAPTNPGGLALVRKSTGTGDEDEVDADTTRLSVLSAMFKPLNQGKVGSCFATAPVRQMRETQPLEAMKVLGEIASTGQYKPPHGAKVPAVTNIPDGDDPLQRSWEYSLATSAARSDDSVERKKFLSAVSGPLDNLKDTLPGSEEEKGELVKKLKLDISQAFHLEYDATAAMGDVSRDGSSKKGHFVAVSGGKAITSFKDFGEELFASVLASLGVDDPNSETGKKVKDVLDHEMLRLARYSDFKPWDIPSGGSDAPTLALYGEEKKRQNLVEGGLQGTSSERSTQVLTSFMKSFGGSKTGMVGLGVSGTHSFNGLPNHPSLKSLKSDDEDGMSEEALGTRIDTELIQKGRILSDTALTPERTAWMFDQRLNAVLEQESDEELRTVLKEIAKTKRPKKALKPAALARAVIDALQPYFDMASDTKKPASASSVMSGLKNHLIRELGAPEFVLADSNWGDSTRQIFFAVAPDPLTGEPTMWRKTEPPGTLSPLNEDWLDVGWFQAGAPV